MSLLTLLMSVWPLTIPWTGERWTYETNASRRSTNNCGVISCARSNDWQERELFQSKERQCRTSCHADGGGSACRHLERRRQSIWTNRRRRLRLHESRRSNQNQSPDGVSL